jgi:uncharacterized lipoprotein YehR (DUF1307 family)
MKRIIALAIIICLVLSLVGCGQKKEAVNNTVYGLSNY